MLKGIFGSRPANKIDVLLAAGAAVMAVTAFFNTFHEFKTEQDNKKENEQ
jgi:hypothetical protein